MSKKIVISRDPATIEDIKIAAEVNPFEFIQNIFISVFDTEKELFINLEKDFDDEQ